MTGLLTPKDAADRLQVKPDTIKDWLRDGKLRGCKIGKSWRIDEADLQIFIQLKYETPNK